MFEQFSEVALCSLETHTFAHNVTTIRGFVHENDS